MGAAILFRRLLIAGCLLILVALQIERLLSGDAIDLESLEPVQAHRPQVQPVREIQLPVFERLSLVQTFPLFNESRTPYQEESDGNEITHAKKKKIQLKKPNMILTGVAINDSKQIVLLRDKKTRETDAFPVGGSIYNNNADWTIEAVSPRQVVLENRGQKNKEVLDLDLYVDNPGPGLTHNKRTSVRSKRTRIKDAPDPEQMDEDGDVAAAAEQSASDINDNQNVIDNTPLPGQPSETDIEEEQVSTGASPDEREEM